MMSPFNLSYRPVSNLFTQHCINNFIRHPSYPFPPNRCISTLKATTMNDCRHKRPTNPTLPLPFTTIYLPQPQATPYLFFLLKYCRKHPAKLSMLTYSSKRGLTLIETVVIVATIAALALLLMTTVSQTLKAADGAKCASHLRQIGIAYLMRIMDDGGYFPASRQRNVYNPATGGRGIAPNAFIHEMLSHYIHDPAAQLREPDARAEDAEVYWCPGRDPTSTSLTMVGGQDPIHSYSHNTALGGNRSLASISWEQPDNHPPNPNYHPGLTNIASVTDPSIIIAFSEQTFPGRNTAGHLTSNIWPLQAGSTHTPPYDRQIDFTRHRGYANTFFLDGSLRRMTFDNLKGTGTLHLIPAR